MMGCSREEECETRVEGAALEVWQTEGAMGSSPPPLVLPCNGFCGDAMELSDIFPSSRLPIMPLSSVRTPSIGVSETDLDSVAEEKDGHAGGSASSFDIYLMENIVPDDELENEQRIRDVRQTGGLNELGSLRFPLSSAKP